MSLFDLKGEVAVVLGGTGELGGVAAEALAAAGASVAVLGRNQPRGEARVAAITEKGGKGIFIQADALDKNSLEQALERVISELGAPTVLVNAAGGNSPEGTVTTDHPFEAIEAADWQHLFDMNLLGGVMLPCQSLAVTCASRARGVLSTMQASRRILRYHVWWPIALPRPRC